MQLLETAIDRLSGGQLSNLRSNNIRLSEELRSASYRQEVMRESIAELQLAIEDVGWIRMESLGYGDLEYDRNHLGNIVRMSTLMVLKNPIIKRATTLLAYYVFGRGVEFKAEDSGVQATVDAFLNDPRNRAELTSHQALTMKDQDLTTKGNLFLAFFTEPDGTTVVRSIPFEQIHDIISDPDDRREIWFYKRVWVQQVLDLESGRYRDEERTAYYPDHLYEEASMPTQIGGAPVLPIPVFHLRDGGLSDMRFGVPRFHPAFAWARAYNSFLEDVVKVMKSLARFAWQISGHQGKADVAATKGKLGSTVTASAAIEHNPVPLAGSVFTAGGDKKIEPLKTAGASVSADDGRQVKLMAIMPTGFPETFFGDADVGNHATSKTLDRPTELMVIDRQTLWHDAFETILARVLRSAKRGLRVVTDSEPVVQINFPPVLEHNVVESIGALVSGATLNGYPSAHTIPREELSRMILSDLGVKNIDAVLKLLQPEWDAADQQAADLAAQVPSGGQPSNDRKQFAAAARDLRDALQKLVESGKAA